jgi:hypothetical protein
MVESFLVPVLVTEPTDTTSTDLDPQGSHP